MYLAPKGYSVVTDGWGIETRRDCYPCKHCQKICEVEPRADPNEFMCRSCMSPICPDCMNKPCDHYEKKLDRAEATDRWLLDRFGEKYQQAVGAQREEIERALARQRMFGDMGL